MKRGVVLVGAGGHAKVCMELLRAMGHDVACCVAGPESDRNCLDVPVHHGDAHLARLHDEGHRRAFVAIGNNATRQRMAQLARATGYELINAISPAATLSPTVRLGQGIAIMAGAVVNADSQLDDLVIVNTLSSIDHDARVGAVTHIAPRCGLAGNVTLGQRVFLGIGCTVVPEIVIGDDAVAGAGSVIISDIPPHGRVAGVPARSILKRSSP